MYPFVKKEWRFLNFEMLEVKKKKKQVEGTLPPFLGYILVCDGEFECIGWISYFWQMGKEWGGFTATQGVFGIPLFLSLTPSKSI